MKKVLDAPQPEANANSQTGHHQVAEAQDDHQPGDKQPKERALTSFRGMCRSTSNHPGGLLYEALSLQTHAKTMVRDAA